MNWKGKQQVRSKIFGTRIRLAWMIMVMETVMMQIRLTVMVMAQRHMWQIMAVLVSIRSA
jgi:hypothetical protein